MLAVGVPVQIIKPSGTVIECRPDDPGPLMGMLGSNNPELAIAALIADKPSLGVLNGHDQFRVSARYHQTNPTPEPTQPLMKVLTALEDRGYRPVRKGVRWYTKCPAHDRAKPDSLMIFERRDGKASVKCFQHGGCDYVAILGVLGLTPRDLYP